MNHSFNTTVAEKFGMHVAVLLDNLHFWIEKNMTNKKNFHDGKYWTYNSRKAYSKLFSYMTERQVEYYLKKMEKNGLILIGNYNKISWDRTCWYALTDKALEMLGAEKNDKIEKVEEMAEQCISPNGENDFTISVNRFHEIVEPIPDIKSNIISDKKESKEEIEKSDVENLQNKKITKKNKEYRHMFGSFDDIISFYSNGNRMLKLEMEDFVQMRYAEGKKLSYPGLVKIFSRVDRLSNDNDFAKIAILNKSTRNSWTDVFPLKQDDWEEVWNNELSYLKINDPQEYELRTGQHCQTTDLKCCGG